MLCLFYNRDSIFSAHLDADVSNYGQSSINCGETGPRSNRRRPRATPRIAKALQLDSDRSYPNQLRQQYSTKLQQSICGHLFMLVAIWDCRRESQDTGGTSSICHDGTHQKYSSKDK
jgi:hypothetical protein